jgi:hypothetical protein
MKSAIRLRASTRLAFRGRLHRLGAFYSLAFLLAACGAPHDHLNGFEDLIRGGPSDSGVFVEALGSDVGGGDTRIGVAHWIDDHPCLACFHHDFVASASPLFLFAETFQPQERIVLAPPLAFPEPVAGFPASRSPPDQP